MIKKQLLLVFIAFTLALAVCGAVAAEDSPDSGSDSISSDFSTVSTATDSSSLSSEEDSSNQDTSVVVSSDSVSVNTSSGELSTVESDDEEISDSNVMIDASIPNSSTTSTETSTSSSNNNSNENTSIDSDANTNLQDIDRNLSPDSQVESKLANLQVPFIENQGQIQDSNVKFESATFAGKVYVTEDGITYLLVPNDNGWVIKETFVGANGDVEGTEKSDAKVNYFIGPNPENWKTNVPTYDEVEFKELYPNIDLALKAYFKNIEKVFFISPDGNPQDIAIKIEGAESLEINESGELEIKTGIGTLKMSCPVAFQEFEYGKRFVEITYKIIGEDVYGFEVGNYEKKIPLIIDPTLIYSTYLGGSAYDVGVRIAVDANGNAYVTGSTWSNDFPKTPGAYDRTYNGAEDVFVTKINPDGNDLVYSTYLGGSSEDAGYGIAVDANGNAYVTGLTYSNDFPTTNPIYNYKGNGDAFIAKINPDGNNLVYSTYLGGSSYDECRGIAVDENGNAYVTGSTWSNNFPTKNPIYNYKGLGDAFIAKINPDGNNLVYSTYLGGSGDDWADGGIAADVNGNAYVTGSTWSNDFPKTPGAYDRTYNGAEDVFVTKINPDGNDLVYSTYLGGSSEDAGYGIAVDANGNAYVTGSTYSNNFPTKNPLYNYKGEDAFVTKINPDGNDLIYSTYLGGSSYDASGGIAVDANGNAYVTGLTYSNDFPTTNPIYNYKGNGDAFIAKTNPDGNNLVYSTYLGGSGGDAGYGIAVDPNGNAYVTGLTYSNNFPTKNPIYNYKGNGDAFIAKIVGTADLSVTKKANPNPVTAGTELTYTITVTNNGPSNAQNVILTDILPPEVGGGTVTISIGEMTPEQTQTYTITRTVNPTTLNGTTIYNTATVTTTTTDPNQENNTITIGTLVQTQADITPDIIGGGGGTTTLPGSTGTVPTGTITRTTYQTIGSDTGSTTKEPSSIEVANNIAAEWGQSNSAILVRNDLYADALVAGPYSTYYSPILYTIPSVISQNTIKTMENLNVKKVIIIGGSDAVFKSIAEKLEKIGFQVERINGKDRYETSALVAKLLKGKISKIFVVSGENFSDALALAPYAAEQGGAILLTDPKELSETARDSIEYLNIKDVTIIGGKETITTNVEDTLKSLSLNVSRIWGVDRYETAVEIAEKMTGTQLVIARGDRPGDALAAGALAIEQKAILILVQKDQIPPSVQKYLETKKETFTNVYFIGGQNTISNTVKTEIQKILG